MIFPAAVLAVALVAVGIAPSPGSTAVPCGSLAPRIEQLTKTMSDARPVPPQPYVDAAHRPAMVAASNQADAMVRDAESCIGKYPLTYRASAYELRMTTRFYLHDARWHDDVGRARSGFEACAATYFPAMGERCRGMVAQLNRLEDRFRRLDALFHAGGERRSFR